MARQQAFFGLHFSYVSLTRGTPIGRILLAMRRLLCLALLTALVVPAAAYAAARAPGDGTLSVRDGEGVIQLNVRGAIIGRFDSGTLSVMRPKDDCDSLQVWGATRERPVTNDDGVEVECHFTGKNIRFRFVGGQHLIRIGRAASPARDIDLSVIGRGFVTLRGTTSVQDGQYSFNGEAFQSLPDPPRGQSFELRGPGPALSSG